jgi:hypothetical protein
VKRYLHPLVLAYLATIPAANWFIGHVGSCSEGVCVVPVWPGIYAPSGVLWIGAALWLRDEVQRRCGKGPVVAGIAVGALLSFLIAPPFIAIASAAAFGLSEGLDFLVYTRVHARYGHIAAIGLSNTVGAAIDSLAFLLIAFGSLDFIGGQVLGKTEMTVLAMAVVAWRQRRRQAVYA